MQELAVGERCGITVPTRLSFKESGWDDAIARVGGVERYCFEETQQVEIPLSHPTRLRDYLFTPEPVARADFFVNMPKFKAHPWTTVTFSMKNYIGIQDDRHRLIDHDHKLNEKIADLQYIIQPQFIAIDAITAGEGRMLTPTPFNLGLIIMGNSQVAFDAVCAAIIGLDPRSIDHVRLAEDNGFGTTDLAKIKITGDVSFAEAKARAKGFKVGQTTRVECDGRGLFVHRTEDEWRVYDSRCPHQTTNIPQLALDGCTLTCPKHEWAFDVRSGACIAKGTSPLKQWPSKVAKGRLLALW